MPDQADTAATASRISQSELARELGVSRQAVHDLVHRGVLALGADGMLDPTEARQAILAAVRPSAPTVAGASAEAAGAEDGLPFARYHLAKAEREVAEAAMAKLRADQLAGNLIDRELAIQAAYTAFRLLRDSLGHLPRRVSGQLASMTEPREVQLHLEGAIRELLEGFQAKTLAGLADRLTRGGR